MKKVLLSLVIFLSACATNYPLGIVYTEVKLPVNVTSNGQAYAKSGISECKSVMGLVSFGDCSVEAAKKQGGVSKVYHVDWEVRSVLGILSEYRLVVYGE